MTLVATATASANQGHVTQFCKDFLTAFAIDNSLFLSTGGFETSPSHVTLHNVIGFMTYTPNKEDWEIAEQIKKLHFGGIITTVIFLDNGHGKLLKILMNEMRLFNKGLTGLLPEFDVTPELELTLRLDTLLYVYSTSGSTINLKEMYAVNGKTIVSKIGTYKEEGGLTISTTNMWDRRTNMEGMEIRVATVSYPLLHELYYDKSNTSVIGGGGFFIEPLNILAQKLNFSLKFMPSIDGQWGISINGTWNGLIGMLIRRQADIAAAGLSLTIERAEVTTFGKGFELEEFTLMSPQTTEHEVHLDVHLHIFPETAWCLIGVMVIIFATCFASINYYGINYMHDTDDSEAFTFINGIGLSLTFFRQIYYNVNIWSISSRTLFLTSAVSTYLLYVHYSAYLIATSTSGIREMPVKSFRDALSGGYQVYVVKNTADHGILKYARPGTPMHDVYYNSMEDNPDVFLKSYKVMSKILHAEKALYFGSAYYMSILNDDLTVLDIQVLFHLLFHLYCQSTDTSITPKCISIQVNFAGENTNTLLLVISKRFRAFRGFQLSHPKNE